MNPVLKKLLRYATGAVIGAGLGYAYYFFVGCSGGGCAITSNPNFSMGYGVVFGLLLALATAK